MLSSPDQPYLFGRSLDPAFDLVGSLSRQESLVDSDLSLRLNESVILVVHIANLWCDFLRPLFFLFLVFVGPLEYLLAFVDICDSEERVLSVSCALKRLFETELEGVLGEGKLEVRKNLT